MARVPSVRGLLCAVALLGLATLSLPACQTPAGVPDGSGLPDGSPADGALADRADAGVPDDGSDGPGPGDLPARDGPAGDGPWADASGRHRAEIEALVDPLLRDQWLSGLVIAVADPGGAEVYGLGELAPGSGEPPGASTLFEIGSVTKTFTSLLLARHVEAGELSLDDPVQELLPAGVTVPARGERAITLLDLSTHTSGLPVLPSNLAPANLDDPYADYGSDELYSFLGSYTLTVDPGSRFEYSNLAVGLLGHALGLFGKEGYEARVASQIAGPLGLVDTVVSLDTARAARLAPGHTAELEPAGPWSFDALGGAGAIRSSGTDMLRYAATQAGLLAAPAPLEAAIRLTQGGQRPTDFGDVGLAWFLLSPTRLWHNGETGGYSSFVAYDTERQLAVVILAATASIVTTPLGFELLALAAGEPHQALELPPTVALASDILDRYVGTFELSPSFQLTVTRGGDQGDRLFVQATGQDRFRLYASSETDFYLRVVDAQVRFERELSGGFDTLVLVQNGSTQRATRVTSP